MCIHNSNLNNCAVCIGQSMLGQVAPGSYISDNLDYQMFLKYAELSDGELMKTFYDEELVYKENLERQIEFLKSRTERDIAAHRIVFLNWTAKYRKQITEKRLNDLKAFL
jgi:hypothetical protein